ncbi:MAG TPA: hypothetical protein VJ453_13440 [Terriglobales bacterium]|jgi:hypothetical protein|nr:hypothetical protein [Terriglobales bacterium]
MSYRADKPFGRRRTDKTLSTDEGRYWQQIRRDVDEDPTGLIRRYLRLAEKVLGKPDVREPVATIRRRVSNRQNVTQDRAA